MATTLNIPKLAVTMNEGTLAEWLVADGDAVSAGQALYVIETEKVQNEIESPTDGTIKFLAEAGETYPVGHPIAEIQ